MSLFFILALKYINKTNKWIYQPIYSRKSGDICHSMSSDENVRFRSVTAAILAAILDFSVSPKIRSCYPVDMHYGGPNDVKSIEKKLSMQG